MPSEVRFAAFRKLVERHDWQLKRINGSHHIFEKPDGTIFPVPVHRGMVKPFYVRQAKKIIESN